MSEERPDFVYAKDPRWERPWLDCPNPILEISSQSYDPDRTAVGSSPWQGDLGAPGVRVPPAPTPDGDSRYAIILAGIEVPNKCGLLVRSLRQAATLRAEVTVGTGDDEQTRVLERPIVTPFWSFPDGNISWHLRWRPHVMSSQRSRTAAESTGVVPGTSPNMDGIQPALTFNNLAVPYIPPAAGIPPGVPVYNLGNFADIRFPWDYRQGNDLAIPIQGPGILVLMASVYQSDPETRATTPACNNTTCLVPEDQFLASYPEAVYGRVAGAMTVELFAGRYMER